MKVPFSPPYALEPLVSALRAHCVSGLERHDDGVHTRVIPLSSGPTVVSVSWDDDHVVVTGDIAERDSAELVTIVRRWLDLDANHSIIDRFLGSDAVLSPMVAARPGLRVLGSVDGFEAAILTVLGQQVSLGAARTFGSRFVGAFGEPVDDEFRAFPTPSVVAAQTPDVIRKSVGLTNARAQTVHTLATAAVDGLDLSWDGDPVQFRRDLLALKGIGPWTADYLTVRVLGDRDAFVPDDLVLKRALGVSSGREAAAVAERWSPWRAYALFHLWTSEAFL
ncbi:DNA-3-methyladenine glycosylase family protein [Rhodococcus sp. 27YEA15]|uniref:DNA-3-methyladenine glycosylase family protein n=1 Tax=Rhodococcus sp. 27YEA15 TaxID=3156259 RepID=UPI003C7D459B